MALDFIFGSVMKLFLAIFSTALIFLVLFASRQKEQRDKYRRLVSTEVCNPDLSVRTLVRSILTGFNCSRIFFSGRRDEVAGKFPLFFALLCVMRQGKRKIE